MRLTNIASNVNTYSTKPKSRKSTTKYLLSSRISIPRVASYQCDECGHIMSRSGSYQESSATEPWSSYRYKRPCSLYTEKEIVNPEVSKPIQLTVISLGKSLLLIFFILFRFKLGMNLQQGNIVMNYLLKFFLFIFYFRKAENVYEDICEEKLMATLDVRIKVTEDMIRERDHFGDLVDGDVQFSKSIADLSVNKSNIFNKVQIFKAKLLSRISRLTHKYNW